MIVLQNNVGQVLVRVPARCVFMPGLAARGVSWLLADVCQYASVDVENVPVDEV